MQVDFQPIPRWRARLLSQQGQAVSVMGNCALGGRQMNGLPPRFQVIGGSFDWQSADLKVAG